MRVVEASELGIKPFKEFVEGASRIIGEIEELRGSRVFVLFIGGFRDIDEEFVEIIYSFIKEVDGDLDVILYSGGGLGDQAYIAGRYLQENVGGRLSFIVPRLAKSAATILSCSGDEIVMTRIAELGPIDPVVYVDRVRRYVPVQSIIELFKILPSLGLSSELLRELLDKLPVLEIGDYQRVLEYNVELTAKLLANRMFKDDQGRVFEIAKKLASYKSHRAPITYYDARELGLKTVLAPPKLEELLVKLHMLWKNTILWFEETTIHGYEEPIEINIDNHGVILTKNPLNTDKHG